MIFWQVMQVKSMFLHGDSREGEAGIEAIVIMQEKNDKAKEGYVNRVYQLTADSYVEYDKEEMK